MMMLDYKGERGGGGGSRIWEKEITETDLYFFYLKYFDFM